MDYFQQTEWINYCKLREERPCLFKDSEVISIIWDKAIISKYIKNSGHKIGILYQSEYNILLVDLVKDRSGNLFAYERVIPTTDSVGVVAVCVYHDKYLLLRQYRHALRDLQYTFPRGFGEHDIEADDNVIKELKEEIGAKVSDVRYIGLVHPDSGLTAGNARVYMCQIEEYCLTKEEGIDEIILLDERELKEWISKGIITDGYTLAALELIACADM